MSFIVSFTFYNISGQKSFFTVSISVSQPSSPSATRFLPRVGRGSQVIVFYNPIWSVLPSSFHETGPSNVLMHIIMFFWSFFWLDKRFFYPLIETIMCKCRIFSATRWLRNAGLDQRFPNGVRSERFRQIFLTFKISVVFFLFSFWYASFYSSVWVQKRLRTTGLEIIKPIIVNHFSLSHFFQSSSFFPSFFRPKAEEWVIVSILENVENLSQWSKHYKDTFLFVFFFSKKKLTYCRNSFDILSFYQKGLKGHRYCFVVFQS